MNSKSFLIFLIFTTVVVIAAGISIASRYNATTSGFLEERVFEGFSKKFSNVDEIIVQDKDKTIKVKRSGKNWLMVGRSDYRASSEAVRNILVGVAELRLKEPKTERENLYSRLAVRDVSEPGAKSTLLTINDKNGEVLATLIVGRETSEVAGASDVGRYIRKPGQARSWLAEGRLALPNNVKKWVSPQFLNIANKRVKAVSVLHPDGQVMNVLRMNQAGKKFRVENLPPDREIEYQSDVDNMADGIDKLELEDVRQAGKIKYPNDRTIKTTYRMYDGLILGAEIFEDEANKFWGRFKATADLGASKEIRKETSLINSTVSKWVYELPAHKFRYMSRKLEDVLKQPEKPKSKK
tara:strand:- start:212 stop:1270 length:1059 start_codon:yes stop_codon:yes gene_type:complete